MSVTFEALRILPSFQKLSPEEQGALARFDSRSPLSPTTIVTFATKTDDEQVAMLKGAAAKEVDFEKPAKSDQPMGQKLLDFLTTKHAGVPTWGWGAGVAAIVTGLLYARRS